MRPATSRVQHASVPASTPEQLAIILKLRELVKLAAPDAEETVIWNSLSYHRPGMGGRVKGAVCLISPRADCVQLGFIHGASLPDPERLLQGRGKAKRFVPIRSLADIKTEALIGLIKGADAYDPRDPG